MKEKNFKKAMATLKKVIAQKPNNSTLHTAYYYLGRAYHEEGFIKESITLLQKNTLEKNNFYELSLFELSDISSQQGKYYDAEKYLRLFLEEKTTPDFRLMAITRLAEVLREQKKFGEAESIYLDLSNSGSPLKRAQALLGLGWIKIKRKKYNEAGMIAEKGLQMKVSSLTDYFRYLHGVALLKENNYAKAEIELKKIVINELHPPATRELIWVMLGKGDIDKALKYAIYYLKKFPTHDPNTANFLVGISLFKKANYDEAIKYFKIASKVNGPYQCEALFQLAVAYERKGDNIEAAKSYSAIIKNFANTDIYPSALLGWGNSLIKLKDFSLASTIYAKLAEQKSATPAMKIQALNQIAVCYYKLGKYNKMRDCYKKIITDFPGSTSSAEASYWIAWSEQNSKNYLKARELYRSFLKKYPKHQLAKKARYRMGMSEYQAGHEQEAANTFYDIILNYPNIKIEQNELLWLGSFFMRTADLKKAGTIYEALLKRHPDWETKFITLYYLAEIQRKQKNYKSAIENFQKLANEKDPQFKSLANLGLGNCLRLTNRLDEARKAFNLVRLQPDDPLIASLHLELGLLEKAAGNLELATKHLMKAGLLYDDLEICGEALWEAGKIYEAQDKHAKAIICYKELCGNEKNSYGERYAKKSKWSALAKEKLSKLEKQIKSTTDLNND